MFHNIHIHIPQYDPSLISTPPPSQKSPVPISIDDDDADDVAVVSSGSALHGTASGHETKPSILDVDMQDESDAAQHTNASESEASGNEPLHQLSGTQSPQHNTNDPNTSIQLVSSTKSTALPPSQLPTVSPITSITHKIHSNGGSIILNIEEFMQGHYGRLQKLEALDQSNVMQDADAKEDNANDAAEKSTEGSNDNDESVTATTTASPSQTHKSPSPKTIIKSRRRKRKPQDFERVYVLHEATLHTSAEEFTASRDRILATNAQHLHDNAALIDKFTPHQFKPLEFHFVKRLWIDECDDVLINLTQNNRDIYMWRSPEEERAFQAHLYQLSRPKRNGKSGEIKPKTKPIYNYDEFLGPDEESAGSPSPDEDFSPEEKELPRNFQFRPQTRGSIEELRKQGFSEEEIAKMHPRQRPHADIENPTHICNWKNISLTLGDYNRLEPFEYLNDNILDMARERLEIPENCYVFNTFFYRLVERNPERAARSIPSQKIKIFEKDYLFIPINRNLHWSLLIVCLKGVRHLQKARAKPKKVKKTRIIKRKRRPLKAENSELETSTTGNGEEDTEFKNGGEKNATGSDESPDDATEGMGPGQTDADQNAADKQNTEESFRESEPMTDVTSKQVDTNHGVVSQSNQQQDMSDDKMADEEPAASIEPPKSPAKDPLNSATQSSTPEQSAATDITTESSATPLPIAISEEADQSTPSESQQDTSITVTNDGPSTDSTIESPGLPNVSTTTAGEQKPDTEEPSTNADGDKKAPIVLSENQRVIIGCDSLRQTNFLHGAMGRVRQYLALRWDIERGKSADEPPTNFTSNEFKGTYASVPVQDNDCDCGVFVLRYIQEFLKNPPVEIPLICDNLFTVESVADSRKEMQEFIKTLAAENNFVFPTEEEKEKMLKEKESKAQEEDASASATPVTRNVMDTSSDSDLEIISVTPAPKLVRNRRKTKATPPPAKDVDAMADSDDDVEPEQQLQEKPTHRLKRKTPSKTLETTKDADIDEQQVSPADSEKDHAQQITTTTRKRKRVPLGGEGAGNAAIEANGTNETAEEDKPEETKDQPVLEVESDESRPDRKRRRISLQPA